VLVSEAVRVLQKIWRREEEEEEEEDDDDDDDGGSSAASSPWRTCRSERKEGRKRKQRSIRGAKSMELAGFITLNSKP
jgi:hypothetical protein